MNTPQLLLSLKNIGKMFGTKIALKDVSLDIYQGEVLSLLGINGAGKTTLSSIIATLSRPTQGQALFRNESIYQDIEQYRRIIGYCPQKPNLHPLLSMRDNLREAGRYFGMNENDIEQRITTLSQRLSLTPMLDAMPDILSGGWKQRALLARSLMHSPRLLILDEPTVGLDPHIRRELWELIKMNKEDGVSVLLTTHYLDEAEELSDRVCVLDQGVVRLIKTPQALMQEFEKGSLEDVFMHLVKEEK